MKRALSILLLGLLTLWGYGQKDFPIIQRRNGKAGCLDKKGNVVIPFEYYSLEASEAGMFRARKGDGHGLVDFSGNVVIPLEYNGIWFYSEGRIAAQQYMVGNGFIDIHNNKVIPFIYSDVSEGFHEGLAAVSIRQKHEEWYGYIDTSGRTIIPFIYAEAFSFQHGMALVRDSTNHYGFIDKLGKVVIPFDFDEIQLPDRSEMFDDSLLTLEEMYIERWEFPEGLLAVKKHNRWGYIDSTGKVVIDFIYFGATNFRNGMAEVSLVGSEAGPRLPFFINRQGKCIIDCGNSK